MFIIILFIIFTIYIFTNNKKKDLKKEKKSFFKTLFKILFKI